MAERKYLETRRQKAQKCTRKKSWDTTVNVILKQTKAIADRYSKITTVAFPKDTVNLNSIYIPLTITTEKQKYTIDHYPSELFSLNRKVLIIDVAGMGKSTISKILYLRSISERKTFPILIDLRRLTGEKSLVDCLVEQFGLRPKQVDLFAEFARTQPLLYIFDGFDEVSDNDKVKVSRQIRDFVDQNERAYFLITSRPEIHFSNYTDFKLFKIESLKKNEAYQLITKYGSAFKIEEKAKTLVEELKAKHSNAISSFLENPLLCSLLFRAFEYKSVVPIKRGVFYRQVFDALYDSHDLNKEAGYVREKKTGLHQDDFHRALRATASLFRLRKVVEVSQHDFNEVAKSVSKSLCPDLVFKPDDFLNDVTVAVPVFTRDGNFIRWSHKSLMDYFLCEYLLRDYTQSKSEALHSVAFGSESLANENFLTLVHEADPTLFRTAVTIPALEELLGRFNLITTALPKTLDEEISRDISIYYMGYDVFVSNMPVFSPAVDWRAYLEDAEENGKLKASEYFPQVIYHGRSSTAGRSVGVFMHRSLAALQVPMKSSDLPHLTMHQISKQRPESKEKVILTAPKKSYSLLSSRFDSSQWRGVDDAFRAIDSEISIIHTLVPTPVSLERAKLELEKIVRSSMDARGANIF